MEQLHLYPKCKLYLGAHTVEVGAKATKKKSRPLVPPRKLKFWDSSLCFPENNLVLIVITNISTILWCTVPISVRRLHINTERDVHTTSTFLSTRVSNKFSKKKRKKDILNYDGNITCTLAVILSNEICFSLNVDDTQLNVDDEIKLARTECRVNFVDRTFYNVDKTVGML